jgi:hypothetical protein
VLRAIAAIAIATFRHSEDERATFCIPNATTAADLPLLLFNVSWTVLWILTRDRRV